MSKLLSSLITLLAVQGLQAQQIVETPKLVVSIVVDQLRGDYLQYFSSVFGEKGFKRLINEGLFYHQVEFGFPNVGEASALATIYTGAYPFYHGICSDKRFDFEHQREISIIADPNYLGNYTSDNYSPLALLSSTLGDELKIATGGNSRVFSIAPNAAEAILSAGRNANTAFWLDDYNGKWATTTYYKDIPWYVDLFNSSDAIGNSSDHAWTQSHSHYIGFPYSKTGGFFTYKFGKGEKDLYRKIKQTPLINAEITTLAGRFLEYADFGNSNIPDLLMLTYYAGDYKQGTNTDAFGYEIQDAYFRLDKELEKLFDIIDRKVGLRHTLIMLTSTGYYESNVTLPGEYKPYGSFYPNRCTALLNMYLMATYGQGNWVEGYYNNQIYLNKKLIEDKQINRRELIANAAEFVAQFSGVQDVTTLGQWLIDDSGRSAAFRRGMNKKYSGDLFIELQPGWVVVNENSITNNPQYERNTATLSPLFFWGEYVKKEQIYRKIKATEIAPTLSFILRIRPPNGAKDSPLPEFLTK
jgi:hypothetical protein